MRIHLKPKKGHEKGHEGNLGETMRRIIPLFLYALVLVLMGGFALKGLAQQNPAGMVIPSTAKVRDTFTPLLPQEVQLQGGMIGSRVAASEKHRLLVVD